MDLPNKTNLRAIEFFSGIGGWATASRCDINNANITVVKAYDINPIANQVYSLNNSLNPSCVILIYYI